MEEGLLAGVGVEDAAVDHVVGRAVTEDRTSAVDHQLVERRVDGRDLVVVEVVRVEGAVAVAGVGVHADQEGDGGLGLRAVDVRDARDGRHHLLVGRLGRLAVDGRRDGRGVRSDVGVGHEIGHGVSHLRGSVTSGEVKMLKLYT